MLIFKYFPPRPVHGPTLDYKNIDFIRAQLKTGIIPQKKLNGDRAVLWKIGKEVKLQNRHGGVYSLSVNLDEWKTVRQDYILDGEVYGKKFYPFEAPSVGDKCHCFDTTSVRIKQAKKLCDKAGVEWIYDVDEEYIQSCLDRTVDKKWEGIVAKLDKMVYLPLSSETKESMGWTKYKY